MDYMHPPVLLLCFFLCQIPFSSLACHRDERLALIEFNQTFTVDATDHGCIWSDSITSSWNTTSRDCCLWDGVSCDEMSGHVIELDLSCSQLVGTIDSNSTLFQLSHLQMLSLDGNNFYGSEISPKFGEFSKLTLLDLHSCNLSGSIPKTFSNLTRIEYLGLDNNSLNGVIPSCIFSRPSLRSLILSRNHFSGELEDFKYNNSLAVIDLNENQLQGPIPMSLQNLVNLRELNLSSNNFSGNVDVSIFSNLKQLWLLDLSYNSISLTSENKVKSILPESLQFLSLAACEVKDLEFLRTTTLLVSLDLSQNKIQGRIPDWSNWMRLSSLNLSYNMLTSIDQIPPANYIDLRSNFLQGSLPTLPLNLRYFLISNNSLSGEIPPSICDLYIPFVLDLARNNLMGEVPQCLGNMSNYIEVLDMQHNNLSGKLHITFGLGSRLKSFNLHGNKLEGEIPRSLANCKQLEVLDLGNNRFNDTFPMWLGTLPKLQVLSLRSNKLHGPIIMTSMMDKLFPELRMLDLSSNAFTAELPTSLFHHLKAMKRIRQTVKAPLDYAGIYYQDSVAVVTKGLEFEVVRILSLYTTIDLSNNKFEGQIPNILGDLISLRMLNLSRNGLQGHIPPSLGNLAVVESFDLSSNQLAGEIPQQLASLTSLAVLNLSHNHLEGCIPRGFQFATFENNSYEGNDGLRGFPVSKDCGSGRIPETNNTTNSELDEESDSTFLSELSWIVVLMGYGSGLFVGFIISYVMLSSPNPNWLNWIVQELEYMIDMRRRKNLRNQRHYRRRNNGV